MKDIYKIVTHNARNALRKYITENRIRSLVLGISGGIDSTVTAILANAVCEDLNIPLYGMSLIIENSTSSINAAQLIGEAFCGDFSEVDLKRPFEAMVSTIGGTIGSRGTEVDRIRYGNIQCRTRMVYLYDIAKRNNGIVLSTDNITEYLLGFFTIHGDHNDYGMIQHMWKTEVYSLAMYHYERLLAEGLLNKAGRLKSSIGRDASDDLGISERDLDQFEEESYEEVDIKLKRWLKVIRDKEEDDTKHLQLRLSKVVKMFEASHFKRAWPITVPREELGLGELYE